ncbi:MAG: hypothetical protein J6Q37_02540 [Bacteroidales bacterium]|nr:hypothetical protein [Bacteroidales bacterium]
MYSRGWLAVVVIVALCLSCSPYRRIQKIRSGEVMIGLSVPAEPPAEEDDGADIKIDSIRGSLSEGPIIMNAIRDSETGEMVASDVIVASKVTARFRNVAERAGYVTIGFDITVPAAMADSRWQLKVRPMMRILADTLELDPVYITGSGYRAAQLRGYERYRAFLATIITDTADFVHLRQLEVFLERHFPETYAMKNDSSLISEPMAENLFGVTQRDALYHYTSHLRRTINERRKLRAARLYDRYVKDPIVTEGIRLDTVLVSADGDFTYCYEHTFKSRPNLRKVMVALDGDLYEMGEHLTALPFPDELTFYISSLSSLADMTTRYRMTIMERMVYDNTKALIDFEVGKAVIDTLLGDNASEICRVRRCIENVLARDDLELDSLVIVASCSPEGSFESNRRLSQARSKAVLEHIGDYVPEEWRDSLIASSLPENWSQLALLVENDTVISPDMRKNISSMIASMKNPDRTEKDLSRLSEYRYLREKLYPQLRSVRFDFYLHRKGMQKDTIHTTEIDSVYMAGLQALRDLDYKRAVGILRPYDDYNAALAFMSADYNHSALDVLGRLDDRDPKVCYLMAMVLARLGQLEEAMKYFELCIAYDPYMEHRANLDPEMHQLVKLKKPF